MVIIIIIIMKLIFLDENATTFPIFIWETLPYSNKQGLYLQLCLWGTCNIYMELVLTWLQNKSSGACYWPYLQNGSPCFFTYFVPPAWIKHAI